MVMRTAVQSPRRKTVSSNGSHCKLQGACFPLEKLRGKIYHILRPLPVYRLQRCTCRYGVPVAVLLGMG